MPNCDGWPTGTAGWATAMPADGGGPRRGRTGGGRPTGLRRRRLRLLAAAAVLAGTLAAATVLVACSSPTSSAPKTADVMKGILDHAPTGVAATVAQKQLLVVAVDSAYPPQSSVDPSSHQLVGFNIDVANKVGQALGAKVEFVTPAWDKMAATLKKGTADVAIDSLPITASSRATMAFTSPYVYQDAVVVVLTGAAPASSSADLQGTTIGVVAQSVYQLWLEQLGGVTVRSYTQEADAADAVRAGRIGGLMTDQGQAWQLVDSGAPFELRGPFFYQPLGFATARGQDDLVAVLDHVIAAMRADGTLRRLSEKWYGGHDVTRKPSASVPHYSS